VGEGEGGVVAVVHAVEVLAPVAVLGVGDVVAATDPLGGLVGVDEGLHALVVEGLGLDEVEEVEPDLEAPARVCDLEEEPLRVALGVDVVLENQVVLEVGELLRELQVAGLELGLEDQRAVLSALGPVVALLVPRNERLLGRALLALPRNGQRAHPLLLARLDQLQVCPPRVPKLTLQQLLYVARTDQALERLGVELLLRLVALLPEPRVHDRVLLALGLLLVLQVKDLPQRLLASVHHPVLLYLQVLDHLRGLLQGEFSALGSRGALRIALNLFFLLKWLPLHELLREA